MRFTPFHPSSTSTTQAGSIVLRGWQKLLRFSFVPVFLLCVIGSVTASETWMAIGDQGRTPRSLHGVTSIAAGLSHTVALKQDGTVVAWGENDHDHHGQTTVPTGLSGVIAIAAGRWHTVALKQDGTVVAWGENGYGQTTVPTGLWGVTAISAGCYHTVALKQDGTVVAWGWNESGQTTVPTGLSGVIAIAAGTYLTVALKQDGTVVTWGNENAYGQTPVPTGLNGVTAIATGDTHTVALKQDGTVVAWGNNFQGQTTVPADLNGVTAIAAGWGHTVALKQDGTVVAWGDKYRGRRIMVPTGLSGVTAIAAGGAHTVALKQDGTVVAWGNNGCSQTTVPTDLSDVTVIAAGGVHTVALKHDGSMIAWGENGYGQTTVPTSLSGVIAIAAGGEHTVALKQDGTVVAWGYNYWGQTTVPIGLNGVTSIAVGWDHTVALKQDGTVVAWGRNDNGQTAVPTGLSGVTAIAAGWGHTVALKQDGTVVAWGYNIVGQTTVPTGLSGVIAITAGTTHTVALKQDGTVVAWGCNDECQTEVPTGLTGVTAIAAGIDHTVALKQEGTVVAWGAWRVNNYGQTAVPTGLSGVTAIAAGGTRTWLRVPTLPANSITITNASIPYDGKPHILAISTANGRTPTSTTYNGSYIPPSAPGIYTVVAEADYVDSYGTATGSLIITGGIPGTNDIPAQILTFNQSQNPVHATIKFDAPVTGFEASDLQVTNGSVTNLNALAGDLYLATITPSADGQVLITLPAGAAQGANGHGNMSATASVIADVTPPTPSLQAPNGPFNGSFPVTVTFNEIVQGFTATDIQVSHGTLNSFSGNGANYAFTVTPTTDGPVTISVAAGVCQDVVENRNVAAQITRQADLTPPTVVLSATNGSVNGAFTVAMTFSEAVSGLDLSEITVVNGSASALSGSGTNYTCLITPTVDGPVRISLAANVAQDVAGNGNLASSVLERLYDGTPPSVQLFANAGPFDRSFPVVIRFSEPITGFELSDLEVVNGTAQIESGDNTTTWMVRVRPTTDGTVTVRLLAGKVVDVSGNGNVISTDLTRQANGVLILP